MLRPLAVLACLAVVGVDCTYPQESSHGIESEGGEGPGPGRNRLAKESSPYLLLHAANPVDWYPWGPEAIELAQRLDRPIFLSVGYSTCYWCYRMEDDVFNDPSIAALMNEGFVSIKVDREERPDIDEIYMTATQLMTRRGGWPNSVFLTPELKPFFAGTYFPPEDRGQMLGFPTILTRVRELWETDRERVMESAARVSTAVGEMVAARTSPADAVPSPAGVDRAVESLAKSFDAEWGGFGPAPKFPSPANLYLLLARAREGDARARDMLLGTLHKMSQGALFDHVGGGFHRYATDREWRVPHFEKMLYDNAALAEILAESHALTGDEELARFARGTLDFVLAKLTNDEGGFRSAIDAQTDGHEGAFYVWTREELESVFSAEERERLGPVFGFDGEPNFEERFYTVHLTAPVRDHAERLGLTRDDLLREMSLAMEKLHAARETRKFPLVDDKVLADWNGMMIAAMARAGALLEEPRYVSAAARAAGFVLGALDAGSEGRGSESDPPLQHSWRAGSAKVDAFLDDYAFLMDGLVALHDATGDESWLSHAERLAGEMHERLETPGGGYYQTTPNPYLLFQPRSVLDGAVRSGNGVAASALLDLAERTGKAVYRERAEAAMRAFANEYESYPEAAKTLALAIARHHGSSASASETAAAGGVEVGRMEALALSIVSGSLALDETGPGARWRGFALRLSIREGWHVNAHPASSRYFVPTSVEGPVRGVTYPRGELLRFPFSDEPLAVYAGDVTVRGELDSGAGTLTLVYQACDDERCLSPVEKTISVPVSK